MQLLNKDLQSAARQISIREATYRKLREYMKRQTLPPKLVDVVSVAVERWLDMQEKEPKSE